MRYNFLHITLMLLATLASAASCSSGSEPDLPETATMMEIMFDVDGSTRATVTSSIKSGNFLVFGEFNTTNSNGVLINGEYFKGIKTIFNGNKVSSPNWACTENPQYWLVGQEYSFVAVHPYPATTDLKYYTFSEPDSKVTFNYTLPQDLSMMADIVVAADRRKFLLDSNGNASKVKLTFGHILSQIDIQVAIDENQMYEDETDKATYPFNQDEFIRFHKIDFVGIKDSATFTFAPEGMPGDAATNQCDVTETIAEDVKNAEYSMALSKETGNTAKKDDITNNRVSKSIIPSGQALLMLPQSFATDSEAKMVLSYSINGDSNRLKQIELPLHGFSWEKGKKYNYRFTISDVYHGQIKGDKLNIEINDIIDEGADEKWIQDTEKMEWIFNPF